MSERRYVVEIARAVSDDRIESAADYVAMRLGMDRQRIRTLLAGRTGPVTRPVLADKADSIAEVFTAAGVTVMIMEAPDQDIPVDAGGHASVDAHVGVGADATDYEADYQAEFVEEPHLPLGEWNVDSAWEAEDDDVPWDERPTAAPSGPPADHHGATADARHAESRPGDGAANSVQPPDARSTRSAPDTTPDATRDAAPEATVAKLPSTRWVPSPFDVPLDGPGARGTHGENVNVSWNLRPDGGGARTSEEAGEDGGDLETATSRPWVTPGRSQFGELSAPAERAPLRTYLMWALVVSVVLLIVLQLLFAVRERGADGATYDTGLAAYRSGDFVTARRHWEDIAKAGSPQAQYMLGHLVQNGLGQPWSNAQAAVWYRQAAEKGLPEAQVALADLYIRGVGVEPDLETGARWLEQAARSEYGPALYQYAELTLHGRGVVQDFDAALDLFARAAESGSNDAADYVALAAHVRATATGAQP